VQAVYRETVGCEELKMDRIYIRRKADGKIVFQKPATKKNAERVKFLLNRQCQAGCFVDSYEVDKPDRPK